MVCAQLLSVVFGVFWHSLVVSGFWWSVLVVVFGCPWLFCWSVVFASCLVLYGFALFWWFVVFLGFG